MRARYVALFMAVALVVGVGPASAAGGEGQWDRVAGAPRLDSGAVITMADGRVLGVSPSGAFVFDPATDRWTQTRPSPWRLFFPMLAPLPDGKVLLFGGCRPRSFRRSPRTAIYNPRTEGWTQVGPMHVARNEAAVLPLPNGQVLVAGGNGPRDATPLASTEVYHPRTGRWFRSGPLSRPRAHPGAALLPHGKVMVAGGYGTGGMRTVDILDLASGQWHSGAHLPRPAELPVLVRLRSGSVLAIGLSGPHRLLRGVARYRPHHRTWVRAPHVPGHLWMDPPVTVVRGRPMIVGGVGDDCRRSVFTYRAMKGWLRLEPLPAPRCTPKVVTLRGQDVLAIGGVDVREGEVPAPYRHTTFRFYR